MAICTDCGGTVIEVDTAAGNAFCVACGTVVEENQIVSEVTFGETSSGAAMVQGSYVGQGATRARLGGPFGNRGSMESREQTIANANRKIRSVANVLRLSETIVNSATRMYTLAVEHKFTRGRNSMGVVAVCVYVACRQKQTYSHMLIDFSDILQVNVFELGHIYLQLVQTLNLRLPLVDPSHYIARFAALLEFGEETSKVATDAIRLVQRFDRDWLTRGRRPAGICGAALILASRMNNFRRSMEEIVQVVKIADTTLRKRLEEFKQTPSAKLTLADFRMVDLEEEMDPPAFLKGKEREKRAEEARRVAASGQAEEGSDDGQESRGKGKKGKRKDKGKKRKRKRGSDDEMEDIGPQEVPVGEEVEGETALGRLPIDPTLLNTGILEGTLTGAASATGADAMDTSPPITPIIANGDPGPSTTAYRNGSALDTAEPDLVLDTAALLPAEGAAALPDSDAPLSEIESSMDELLRGEVSSFLDTTHGATLASALDEAEERRQRHLQQQQPLDELLGLDEDELDEFILTEEEVRIKERVWVEINRDYLEAIAARGLGDQNDQQRSRKRRKPAPKPRDASTPHGSTVGESVRKLLKKNPRYSKRINYDALKDIFDDLPAQAAAGDDKDDDDDNAMMSLDKDGDDLFRMDDKSDGEGVVVVEEGGGGVGRVKATASTDVSSRASSRRATTPATVGADSTAGEDAGAVMQDGDDGDDKGDEPYGGWEEAYEQEV